MITQPVYLLGMRFLTLVGRSKALVERKLTTITANGSTAAPYVKAAARDVKAYRDSKNYRDIPVGYSAGKLYSL